MSALDRQIGASHYKDYPIQPVEFCMKNKLDYCQSNIVKYVIRFRDKGGKEDLLKAKHYIDLLWESEYGGMPSEEYKQESQSRPASSIQYCTQSFVP